MGNEKLVRVKSCPWCRSELRTPNNIFDEKTNHYITSLLGTSEDLATELVKEMKGFKCLSCQTTYLDPWFTEDSMSNYFNNQKSVHKVGWGNFRQLVVNEFTSPASEINTEIITILMPEFKTLVKYIEVGCPFMGMLGYLSSLQSGESVNKKFAIVKENFFKDNWYARQFLRTSAANNLFEELLSKFFLTFNMLKYRLSHFGSIPTILQVKNKTGLDNSSIELILTTPRTHLMWRNNCVGEIGTCVSTAVKTFAVKHTNWGELENLNRSNRHKTLIAFFNTLDHQTEGELKLISSLNIAKYVLVATHSNNSVQKQHAFMIEDTIKSLDSSLYIVRDLKLESEKLRLLSEDSFFLISLVKEPVDIFYIGQQ